MERWHMVRNSVFGVKRYARGTRDQRASGRRTDGGSQKNGLTPNLKDPPLFHYDAIGKGNRVGG